LDVGHGGHHLAIVPIEERAMTDESTHHHEKHRDAALNARLVLGGLLLLAIVGFAVDNGDEVRIGWVVGDGSAPLVLVLLVTAVVGALVGWLLLHRPHHQH